MSTTVNNEDLELEEGEIAEDSNDEADLAPDLDCTDQGDAVLSGVSGVGGGISCEAGPQKKRKKVVRKVRRKIKVKKKVVRKKGGSGNNESGGGGGANAIGGSNANVDNNMSSSMSSALASNLNNNSQSMLPSNAPLLPHIAQQSIGSNLILSNQQQHHHTQQQHHNPYQHHTVQNNHQLHHNLLPQTLQQQQQQQQQQHHHHHHQQQQQHLQQTQTNSTQLDSLWEQQILVLQELQRQQQVDQQLTQILRAAATDEDFRIFPSPLTMLANSNQQTMATQLITPMMANTTIASAATSNTNTVINKTITHSPSKPMILHSQTPSSPDDENGKSSYEAISKMLTLLRNSANVSDSSENLEIDNNNDFNNPHHATEDPLLNLQQEIEGTIEYSLIPILIEGIDYTKYKLLSQYEPKFKNDPRLNQQT